MRNPLSGKKNELTLRYSAINKLDKKHFDFFESEFPTQMQLSNYIKIENDI